jgi:hypothetical protein
VVKEKQKNPLKLQIVYQCYMRLFNFIGRGKLKEKKLMKPMSVQWNWDNKGEPNHSEQTNSREQNSHFYQVNLFIYLFTYFCKYSSFKLNKKWLKKLIDNIGVIN